MAKRSDTPTPSSSTSTGQREYVPEFFSTDTGEGLPEIDPSPGFIYAHHRKRWCVINGEIVPELSKIPLVSGCNRVIRAPDGRYRFADTQAMFQDRHFKLIQPTKAPNGRSYLQEVDTMADGRVVRAVISVWETAHAGEKHTSWDFAGYVDWLKSLVKDGVIAPITPHRASEMLSAAKSLLSKAELRLSAGRTNSPDRVEGLRAEVAALEKVAKLERRTVETKESTVELDMSGGAS